MKNNPKQPTALAPVRQWVYPGRHQAPMRSRWSR